MPVRFRPPALAAPGFLSPLRAGDESGAFFLFVPTVYPTQDYLDALNRQQRERRFHPYTCGNRRDLSGHLDGEGVLVATTDGWACPYCDYRQPFGTTLPPIAPPFYHPIFDNPCSTV